MSNGPSPQWCCHHSSTKLNGSATNQSATSSTIPTITALPIRPSPIERTRGGSMPREHDERRERRRHRQ